MKYTYLGRTGLQVSRLCLGTMNFGPVTDEASSFRIMDHALELGINFFDTADFYGRHIGKGATEELIGRWFAQGGGRREKVVLATKMYGMMDEWPNNSKVSALYIRKACEASLKRLQTDHIDLYQMHHIFRQVPWEETWQGMEQLVGEGKIIYNGSSNFAAWNIVQANERAKERHFLGLVSEQSIYHLNARMIELEVIPACENYGIGILPWSPLGGGLLAGGAYNKHDSDSRRSQLLPARLEKEKEKISDYESLCKEIGEKPADIALAWLLQNKAVTAPIIGPRTDQQLTDSLRALEITLTEETNKKLDLIFPGPGGQAPEAYAW
jgi:aryl-alcohol dehydrogenase-like predicted oxidoreductase